MEDSSSASYIRMVHHLIEKCLLFHMSQEECVEALLKHAKIKPVITNTVWKELEKENREFFDVYSSGRDEKLSATETMKKVRQMLSDVTSKSKASPSDG